jgi:hypothetical protein
VSPPVEVAPPPTVESVIAPHVEPDPAAMFSEWLSGPAAQEPPAAHELHHGGSGVHERWDVPSIEEHHEQTVHEHGQNFEVEEPVYPPADPPGEIVVPPLEVIDKPARRRKRESSREEVADLLRTLRQREQIAAEQLTSASSGRDGAINDIAHTIGLRIMGWASLSIGVIAIGVACVPPVSPYAIPMGATGLLLALTGVVLATLRQVRRFRLLVGGATASAMGIALPILSAFGILPTGGHNTIPRAGMTPPVNVKVTATDPAAETMAPAESDAYIPATSPAILNHIEIRVASAQVLQPAIYSGDFVSLHTMGERRVQITLELKDLGSDSVTYEPWRKGDGSSEDAKLTDTEGNPLLIDVSPGNRDKPATLTIGSVAGPSPLAPGGPASADVLLFKPPENPHQDLKLDLPGANLGVPNTTVHIRIPATMVQAD